MLQRIYGTAFLTQQALDEHLAGWKRRAAGTIAVSVKSWSFSASRTRSGAA